MLKKIFSYVGHHEKKGIKKYKGEKRKKNGFFKNNEKKIFVFSLGKCEKNLSFYYYFYLFIFLLQPTC